MWMTTILLLILLSVLSCLHVQNSGSAPSQQVQLQSNGMDYALFGYNSLKGCPLTLGYDLGFTFPIFSAQSQVMGDNGGPRGVILSHDVSCDTSFTSTVVETPYDLTTLLTGTARLGADKWGPPFSASQHFLKFSEELKQNVLVLSTAVCSIYHVKLLLWEPPSFHSSFVDWIIKLNNTDDEDMYLKFLDTYGTHFVSRARFGASITVVHKMEDKVYRNLTEGHVRSAASFVAAALFGQPQTLTSDQQKAANEFQNEVETTTIAVGVPLPYAGNSLTWLTAAKDQPSAIHYDLTSVEVLFSDTLMGNSSLIGSYGIDHFRIMNNILAVKTKYCWTVKRQDLTGLSNLHLLLKRPQRLRVDLGEKNGKRIYAEYSSFRVDGPDTNYRLFTSGYSGDAGDSLTYHEGDMFSTFDRDNDKSDTLNCAVYFKAAWWFRGCYNANLNGQYHVDTYGVSWYLKYQDWRSFSFSEMKLRPA